MSRQIDLTKPLSKRDREYLEIRNRHLDIAKNDTRFSTGEEEEEEASYAEWTNEELREELKVRELSAEGKKAEMVQRLEEHDAVTE